MQSCAVRISCYAGHLRVELFSHWLATRQLILVLQSNLLQVQAVSSLFRERRFGIFLACGNKIGLNYAYTFMVSTTALRTDYCVFGFSGVSSGAFGQFRRCPSRQDVALRSLKHLGVAVLRSMPDAPVTKH